jgi:hypothetical protein
MEEIFTKDKLAQTRHMLPIRGTASNPYPVSLQVDGALGSDVITITLIGIDGATETDAYDSSAAILTLSATTPVQTFYGPMDILISKPITTNDIGLKKVVAF